jgi:hypothetical protein
MICLLVFANVLFIFICTLPFSWAGDPRLATPWFEIRVGCNSWDSNVCSTPSKMDLNIVKCWLRFNFRYNYQTHRWMWVHFMPLIPQKLDAYRVAQSAMGCRPSLFLDPHLTGAFYAGNFREWSIVTSNNHPSNPQQAIQQPYVKRTSKCLANSNLLSVSIEIVSRYPVSFDPRFCLQNHGFNRTYFSSNAPNGSTNSLFNIFKSRKIMVNFLKINSSPRKSHKFHHRLGQVLTRYGSDASCLTDVMRASLIYPTIAEARQRSAEPKGGWCDGIDMGY